MPLRLRVPFAEPAAFREEYERNIVNGGVFIHTQEEFELRDLVEVELELDFCGESVVLEAEIVHCVSAEQAGSAAGAGIAVQFLASAAELRERLEHLVGGDGAAGAEFVEPAGIALDEGDASALDLGERSADGQVFEADATRVFDPFEVDLSAPERGEDPPAAVESSGEAPPARVDSGSGRAGDVNAGENEPIRSGISGAIEELGMLALVRMFGMTAKQGTLTLDSGAEQGSLGFESEMLRYAELGDLRGVEALARLFSWERGSFEFHARLDPGAGDAAPLALEEAIQEALRRRDGMDPVGLAAGLDPGDHFTVDTAALAAESGLTKTQQAVLDLASVGFTVGRMLDVIPETEAEVFQALEHLLDREIIRSA